MENFGVQNLKVGQLAEFTTFERGFRCAWFRCKVVVDSSQIVPISKTDIGRTHMWLKSTVPLG